jgi:hypothetical protein
MKSVEWKTYRTRFLVKAKQLSSNLTFIDPLGRQHSGRKGDYLVESDGMLRIAPRQIFEDIYVTIAAHEEAASDERKRGERKIDDRKNDCRKNDNSEMIAPRKPVQKTHHHRIDDEAVRRKLPQSSRDHRPSATNLGMM